MVDPPHPFNHKAPEGKRYLFFSLFCCIFYAFKKKIPSYPKHTFDVQESSSDDVTEISSRLSTVQIDNKVSSALKLPPLFSLTPNSTAKTGNFYKRQAQLHTNVSENLPLEQTASSSQVNTPQTGYIWFFSSFTCLSDKEWNGSVHSIGKEKVVCFA